MDAARSVPTVGRLVGIQELTLFELPGRNQMDKVKAESCSAGLRFENLNTLSALNTLIVMTLLALLALPKKNH